MIRRPSSLPGEADLTNFIIRKCQEVEAVSPFDAKAWLLTGKSILKGFPIQYETYRLERRLENVDGASYALGQLFYRFGPHIREDMAEIAAAVRLITLSPKGGKEASPAQAFLHKVFKALPKNVQIEILIQVTEFTHTLFEKCQTMLVLVRLFPETINQKNGGEMLFTLLACESDVNSTFRKLLVSELVPSVLTLGQNLAPSPRFLALLNQSIEYYTLVEEPEDLRSVDYDLPPHVLDERRWDKLFSIVDSIGDILQWSIAPFFQGFMKPGGGTTVESLFRGIQMGFQHRNHYSSTELAYVTVVVFLRCIVGYHTLLRSPSSRSSFGKPDKARLVLVEVFLPRPHRGARVDKNLPVLTTVSNHGAGASQAAIISHFLHSVKIWETVISIKGETVEKEFFDILFSMTSLNLNHWVVFQEFMLDYHLYIGQPFQDANRVQHSLKLASIYCSVNNFKSAAECAIKGVSEAIANDPFHSSSRSSSDFSFYNSHVYNSDGAGNFVYQRRVHFLSDNRSELLAYAANILIQCFHESVEVALASNNDRPLGHLLTLLQLEWKSSPAETVFSTLLDIIKRKGSFSYFPFFYDFIIEPDFLETFMAIFNHEGKAVKFELFPCVSPVAAGRRIGTRGVEKGSKNEFRSSMYRQMLKNGREDLETLISKFLTLNKVDILTCFDY